MLAWARLGFPQMPAPELQRVSQADPAGVRAMMNAPEA